MTAADAGVGAGDADQHLVDMLEAVWRSIAELGAGLSETEWKQPTDCPGWTVQDTLAHLCALELSLHGRPAPEVDLPRDLPHVKNDFGAANERGVEARRSSTGAEVLNEFGELTRERIERLRALDATGFAKEASTPIGPGTVRDALSFRIFDSWVHGQDMRRAVDRPGDRTSAAAEHVLQMMLGMMSYVIGKKVGAPDGSTIVFVLTGDLARDLTIAVDDGRAQVASVPVPVPTVTLTMDSDTFGRLSCGRIEPSEAVVVGSVAIDGDVLLGGRILGELNYLF